MVVVGDIWFYLGRRRFGFVIHRQCSFFLAGDKFHFSGRDEFIVLQSEDILLCFSG